jgi:hypothetical protein
MKTAAGIVILLVILLVAVFVLWVTKGAGPLNPYPPIPPTTGLTSAIKDVQTNSMALSNTLASLTSLVNSGPTVTTNLANANAAISGAPTLDITPVNTALASYNTAVQGSGGAQAAITSYNAIVRPLSTSSSISALLAANDNGSLESIVSTLQGGSQSTSETVLNLVNTVTKNAALAGITNPTLATLLSTITTYTQNVLAVYGNLVAAAKQTSAAASVLVRVVEGTNNGGSRSSRQAFMGYPNIPCRSIAPGSSECQPPFAVCMTEKCRTDYGCDVGSDTHWQGVYENPIIASGAGLTIWP